MNRSMDIFVYVMLVVILAGVSFMLLLLSDMIEVTITGQCEFCFVLLWHIDIAHNLLTSIDTPKVVFQLTRNPT